MLIQPYSANSCGERRPGHVFTFLPGKRLFTVVLCLLCNLFLQIPAAATLEGLYVGAEAPDFTI